MRMPYRTSEKVAVTLGWVRNGAATSHTVSSALDILPRSALDVFAEEPCSLRRLTPSSWPPSHVPQPIHAREVVAWIGAKLKGALSTVLG